MTDPLQKLFGSAARMKLLRLFLFNPKFFFTIPDAASRSRVTERTARSEIGLFSSIKLIKRAPSRQRSGGRFTLNPDFPYAATLQELLLNTPERSKELYERLRGAGAVKLVVVGGIFMGEWEGRLDILVVGDRVSDKKLRVRVRALEAELGKELRYALLSTQDFFYRLNMNDKLVRDVLDYPHKVVFDRLDIGLK